MSYFAEKLLKQMGDIRKQRRLRSAAVGDARDSRQILNYKVHSSLVVAYSRVRRTRVRRTLEYATPG